MSKPLGLLLVILGILTTGCISKKKLNYFQDAKKINKEITPEAVFNLQNSKQIKIQPYDILDIKLADRWDPSFNEIFNTLAPTNSNRSQTNIEGGYLRGYLVDEMGNVNLPIIGKLKLSGLSINEAEALLLEKLKKQYKEPFVQIKFLNFKVYVFGEVKSPGVINIQNEAATVVDAIGISGDFSDLANRSNVKVFRGEGDSTVVYSLNLNSIASMKSEGFYLQPYDIIYIEPLQRKTLLANISTFNIFFGLFNAILGIILINRFR